jgi:hypothetical protein
MDAGVPLKLGRRIVVVVHHTAGNLLERLHERVLEPERLEDPRPYLRLGGSAGDSLDDQTEDDVVGARVRETLTRRIRGREKISGRVLEDLVLAEDVAQVHPIAASLADPVLLMFVVWNPALVIEEVMERRGAGVRNLPHDLELEIMLRGLVQVELAFLGKLKDHSTDERLGDAAHAE